MLIVGDKISPEVALLTESIQSAPHLEFTIGLAELSFYSIDNQEDKQLLVIPQVVGKTLEQTRAIVRIIYEEKPPKVEVTPLEPEKSLLNKENFLKTEDADTRAVFKAILNLSDIHGFPINWGTKGFSLNVDVEGKRIALCYGYGSKAYGGKINWTSFTDIKSKVQGGEEIVTSLRKRLRQTGLFTETKKEMKYDFKQKLTETQIKDLTDIIVDLENQIENTGAI